MVARMNTMFVLFACGNGIAEATDWTWIEDAEFRYFPADISGTQAEARCVNHGAHLATINSASQNAAVFALITNEGNPYIGLTDATSEGDWVWTDGSPVVYTNWQSGEPNNYADNEDCAAFHYYSSDGMWNDVSCGNDEYASGFVCSRPYAPSSTPALTPVPTLTPLPTLMPFPTPMLQWDASPSLPYGIGWAAVCNFDGKVVLVGGADDGGSDLGSLWMFDPSTQEYESTPLWPRSRCRGFCAICSGRLAFIQRGRVIPNWWRVELHAVATHRTRWSWCRCCILRTLCFWRQQCNGFR